MPNTLCVCRSSAKYCWEGNFDQRRAFQKNLKAFFDKLKTPTSEAASGLLIAVPCFFGRYFLESSKE